MNERFVQYLAVKKLTIRALSDLSGISVSTISRFCTGKEIGSGKLLRMLQVCDDLSLEWFFYGTGEMIRKCDSITYNLGQYAGADVTNKDSVMINGSRQVKVQTGSPDYYVKMLAEKDKMIASRDAIISQRDKTISDLISKLSNPS